MPNLSRGIMLEGISCSGKTSTMYALKRLFSSDLNLERNIIMLGEHYTQVLNSVNGVLKHHEQNKHIDMLFERVAMIEQLHEWGCSLGDFRRTSRGLYTVLERGLINHIAYYKDFDDKRIIELSERFSSVGMEVILLIVSDENIKIRIQMREHQMNISDTESNRNNLTEQLKIQQDDMLTAIQKTKIPSRIIYTDSMNWDEYAKIITLDSDVI